MTRSPLAVVVAFLVAALQVSPSSAGEVGVGGLAGAPAGAPAGFDTVELRDGGLVRGTIVELRPGERVTVIVAGEGGTRTFAWEEVATTRVGGVDGVGGVGVAPVGPSTPVDLLVDVGSGPAPGRGRPRLTIEVRGRRQVHLFTPGQGLMVPTSQPTVVRSGTILRSVCQAPCGQVIDGRDGYPFFFGGDRVPLSRPLYLNDAEGDMVAEVRPGRLGFLVGGVLATSYGLVGTIAGATLVGIDHERFGRPGGITLGVGAALLVSGIVMMVRGQTRFKLRRR